MPATSQSVSRLLYAAYVLFFVAPGNGHLARFGALATFPDAFFHPPFGPMRMFAGFPSAWALNGVALLACISAVALLVGYHTWWASLLTGGLLLVGYGFSYSMGKVNHNMLLILAPLVMAFSNWGERFSYDAWRAGEDARTPPPKGWPIALMALLLGVAMGTAGLSKLLGGWLDLSTHAVQGHITKMFFVNGRQDLLAPLVVNVDSAFFWEAQDYFGALFEVVFLFAIFSPKMLRRLCAVAVVFHLGVALTMNIMFAIQLPVYALFVDWKQGLGLGGRGGGGSVLSSRDASATGLWAGGGILAAGGAFYALGSPVLWVDRLEILNSGGSFADFLLLVGAFVLVLLLMCQKASRRWGASYGQKPGH